MKGVWNKVLQREKSHEPPVEEIIEDIVNLGPQIGIDLDENDIKEGLTFDNKDLSEMPIQIFSDQYQLFMNIK